MRSGNLAITVLGLAAALAAFIPSQAMAQSKSAQNDCARTVASRGYSVVRSANFRQQPDGWLLDMQVRSPQGLLLSGTCHVQTSTGAVTLKGFVGAFDDVGGGGANMTFDCASNDGKYRECQLPVDGRARLVKRYSRAPCTENQSWGQRGDRVWVSNGCRARFEVAQGGGGGGSGHVFDCRSIDGRYQECRIKGGSQATLVRAYTGNCRQDSTWGVRPGVVWVTAGCQAQFRATGGSAGPGGAQPRAEAACRVEAQRQYISVRQITPARNQGSYWQATVTGLLRNQPVQADCRYDPQSNQASLFIQSGGGSGASTGTGLKVKAEQACMAHAKRVGYTVYGQSAAESAQNALRVGLKLKQGNQLSEAVCYYDWRTGQTRLEQVRPQPR
jgi:Protein of unknown function (DUF3011)